MRFDDVSHLRNDYAIKFIRSLNLFHAPEHPIHRQKRHSIDARLPDTRKHEKVHPGYHRRGKSNIQGRTLFDLARSHGVKDRCNLPDIVLLTKISNDVAPGPVTPTLYPVFEDGRRILSVGPPRC